MYDLIRTAPGGEKEDAEWNVIPSAGFCPAKRLREELSQTYTDWLSAVDIGKPPERMTMCSILFVDDDRTIADVGTRILKTLGYTVLSVPQSDEALAVFRKRPMAFDLIITDYMMPGMKGNELASEIRLIRTDIPILLCTGRANIPDASIREWGFDAQILKPFRYSEMASTVHRVIKKMAGPCSGRF